jgi:hypothetical protein
VSNEDKRNGKESVEENNVSSTLAGLGARRKPLYSCFISSAIRLTVLVVSLCQSSGYRTGSTMWCRKKRMPEVQTWKRIEIEKKLITESKWRQSLMKTRDTDYDESMETD